MLEEKLYGKRVAIIIAFRDFRDAEYFIPKEILVKEGATVVAVSTGIGIAIGADGGEVNISVLVEEVKPADFDAIVFIGGPGALEYLDNQTSYNLAREAVKEARILAAICVSPMILAKAGVLKEKKATVWSSSMDREPVRTLKHGGAIYEDRPVVVDGKIITANGPEAAKEFAKALVRLLTIEPERI